MNDRDPQRTLPGSQPPSHLATVEHVAAPPPNPDSDATMLEPQSNDGSPRPARAPIGLATIVDQSARSAEAPPKPESRSKPNVTIPGYDVVAELGRGGMGVVYKVRNVNLQDKIVAIKMMSRNSMASLDDVVRFRAEAEMVAVLQHENIIDIYDIKTDNGLTYLILEYIDGGNLADKLKSKRPAPREAAQMIETLARAIHFAHQKKIIHRDLKPANVLVTRNGTLKITDFGLGKLLEQGDQPSRTHAGAIMGTPPYMAPEQASGRIKEVGPSTDIYALGAILYEMLTGRLLFMGENLTSLLQQMQNEEPIPPSWLVPLKHRERQLSTICLKCLEKNPTKRYATALELADELRRWLDEQPILTKPIGRIAKAWRFVKKHPVPIAVGVFSTLVIAGLIIAWLVDSKQRDHRLYEESRQRTIEAQAHAKETREQHRMSLDALSAILDEAYEGSLSKQIGLGKLRHILRSYYNTLEQDIEQLDPSDRARLANDLTRLGVLISRAGDKTEALKVLERAKGFFEQSTTAQNPEVKRNLALTFRDIATLKSQMGDWDEAERAYHDAERLLNEMLSGHELETGRLQRDLAEVYHLQGILYNERKRMPDDFKLAEEYYLKGLNLRLSLKPLAGAPDQALDDQRNLARSYGYLGDVLVEMGRGREADQAYWASHRIRDGLVEDYQARIAIEAADEKTRIGKAIEEYRRGLAEARFQLARSWGNFGNFQTRRDAAETAIYFYERSRAIREELVRENSTVVEYMADLCSCYNRLADLRLLSTDESSRNEAAKLARQAIEISRKLLEIDPNEVTTRKALADSQVCLAIATADTDPEQSRSALNKAARLLEALPEDRRGPDEIYNLAAIKAMQTERAGKFISADELLQWKRDASKLLSTAARTGVRSGKDYQKLVADVRAFKVLRGFPEPTQAKEK